ncbi:MAG: hypothetical protein RIF39_15655 [Cyclobacteriaceae bacterium]
MNHKDMLRVKTLLVAILLTTIVTSHYGQEANVQINRDHNKIVIKNRNGFSSFDVELRGKIQLTDDDKDIKSMSPDGYLYDSFTLIIPTNEVFRFTPYKDYALSCGNSVVSCKRYQ